MARILYVLMHQEQALMLPALMLAAYCSREPLLHLIDNVPTSRSGSREASPYPQRVTISSATSRSGSREARHLILSNEHRQPRVQLHRDDRRLGRQVTTTVRESRDHPSLDGHVTTTTSRASRASTSAVTNATHAAAAATVARSPASKSSLPIKKDTGDMKVLHKDTSDEASV